MGMFDDVSLTPGVRDMVREQYRGEKEIRFDGWQSKSLDCGLHKIVLAVDHIDDGRERRPHFTGEIRFYQPSGKLRTPEWEWLEFVAVYVDGKIVAVHNASNSTT